MDQSAQGMSAAASMSPWKAPSQAPDVRSITQSPGGGRQLRNQRITACNAMNWDAAEEFPAVRFAVGAAKPRWRAPH